MDDGNGPETLAVQHAHKLEPTTDDSNPGSTSNSAPSIPDRMLPCCCEADDCAFQRRTQETFASLDKNLRKAGRLGQALLVRHETYVAEAERDKARMDSQICSLVLEKKNLEDTNSSLIDENRSLLDQLECLNNATAESEAHIQSLTTTLESTQAELSRLSSLASRTERLERELEEYEQEQATLQASLACKTESEKAANLRWQEAERKLAALESQVERIEHEAKNERERHVEIVGRMERQRVVEKELETAAGRLKGAAAVRTMGSDKHGSTVVSHFVKDILQDNANLQMGIVELREMLANSNEEVEQLRERLAQYSPVRDTVEQELPPHGPRSPNLGQEMNRASMQELHVHHHYHAPAEHARKTSQTLRRPKKKRNGINSGLFSPSTGARTPRSSISTVGPYTPASASTILSQTAASIPPRNNNRWSMQSGLTVDTMVSSPQSTYPPSIFDRSYTDSIMDSSRPTTPGSEDFESPPFLGDQSKRSSSASYFRSLPQTPFRHSLSDRFENLDIPSGDLDPEDEERLYAEQAQGGHGAILEEDEGDHVGPPVPGDRQDHSGVRSFIDDTEISNQTRPSILDRNIYSRPTHRRATSHDSLMSVSGMDIHTLSHRPSQLLTGQTSRGFSSVATVSATTAHAAVRPTMTSRASSSSHSLLQGMASDQRMSSAPSKGTLGQRVGGWVFGRWGTSPTPTVTVSAPMDHINPHKQRASSALASKLRPPGINQPGPILGFGPEPALPQEPVLKTLNEEELRQSLNE